VRDCSGKAQGAAALKGSSRGPPREKLDGGGARSGTNTGVAQMAFDDDGTSSPDQIEHVEGRGRVPNEWRPVGTWPQQVGNAVTQVPTLDPRGATFTAMGLFSNPRADRLRGQWQFPPPPPPHRLVAREVLLELRGAPRIRHRSGVACAAPTTSSGSPSMPYAELETACPHGHHIAAGEVFEKKRSAFSTTTRFRTC